MPQELETANLYTAPILIEEGTVVTAVAVAEGAEISQPATASYAVLRVSVPNFADLKAGYEDIEAQPLLLRAIGSQDGTVESVSLSGDGAASFVLTGEE